MNLLVHIGLVRRLPDGSIRWPFARDPAWMRRIHLRCALRGTQIPGGGSPWIGVFRNLPSVVKWEPGRLLPRRWGVWFPFLGFEIGDRG